MTCRDFVSAAVHLLARCDVASNGDALLRSLAAHAGLDAGELWLADDDATLRLGASWYSPGLDAHDIRAAGEALICRPGEGLPGRALSSGIITWVDTADVRSLLRGDALSAAGIATALAIPMRTRHGIAGVLLFFSRADARPEQAILDELTDVASIAGELLQGQRNRRELHETSAKLKLLLDESQGVTWSVTPELEISKIQGARIHSRADAEKVRARYTTVVRSAEPIASAHRAALEGQARTFDANAAQRRWSCRVAPVRSDGETIVVGAATDVTAAQERSLALRRLADASSTSSRALFTQLANELAQLLGTEIAMISAVEAPDCAHILGGSVDGEPLAEFAYDLRNTPCSDTIERKEMIFCASGVASRWTSSTTLHHGVDGYLGMPLVDSSGNVIGVAAAMSRRPLTVTPDGESFLRIISARAAAELERMRLAETAAAAEERHRSVAEALADAVITIDHNGIIEGANEAATRIFGFTREELLGANVSMLMPSPHAEQHDSYLRRYLATGTMRIFGTGREVIGLRKNGTEVPLRITLHETRLPSKRIFTGILRDLSEITSTKRALHRCRAVIADTQRLTHIGNWVWHIDTNDLEWSDEIYRIFGRERESFQPTYPNFLATVHPDDRDKVRAAVDAALASGTPYSIEHRVVRPDESEVLVHERGELQFEQGRPVRMIGTVQDITERQRSHERLWKLSSAVEQTDDHVMITDREGRIEYVNPAFERVSGYSRESVIGQTPRILKSGQHSLNYYKQLWDVILAGHTFRGVFINRTRDGRIVYEEKTITPVRSASGEITHFVSTGRDITDRREAERQQEELRNALQLSATEWRLTFDAIDFPIFVCDREGIVHRANAAAQKLSELPFSELIGRPLSELPRCQPWIGATDLLREAAAGHSVSAQVREPVSRRTWELAAAPFSRDNEVSLVIFIARDMTALLELQESLRRTEVMSTLGALVAGVAHEVRNPLFAISATIDAFEGSALDQSRFDQFTARLRAELTRMTELMRDLLEYGRPTDAELTRGTLREPIELALRTTDALATKLGITVDARIDGYDAVVMRDAHRLHIAVRNLLDNAIRHAGERGTVTLDVACIDDAIEIAIRDSGDGFVPSDIPHLFEPFFTRRRGGTGLGLSIVHRTIEQHGGTIAAANHPDGGALMRIRLPLAEPAS